jgi:glucan endo-1,3-beta-D-glucosidase
MYSSGLLAFAAIVTSAAAGAIQGFNYGATHTDGSAMTLTDFTNLFNAAKVLAGTNGAFTSARLYTSIQAGTSNSPSAAFEAAVNTNTRLLLGLWASSGSGTISDELDAINNAISLYGTKFTSLVDGISVGSEDLYRITPTSIENSPPGDSVGAEPDQIISYISTVKSSLSGTGLSGAPIGHVDTWTAWVNGSNSDVVSACDFIGMDAYPYFQTTMANDINGAAALFKSAYDQTVANALGKPVWVTETGWPISGPTQNQAVPGTTEAETYWQEVGCGELFGEVNTWWYTLNDASPSTPSPSFGIIPSSLSNTPAYNLTCGAQAKASASVAATQSLNTASLKASGSAALSQAASATGLAPVITSPSAPGQSGSAGSGSGSGTVYTVNGTLATSGVPTPVATGSGGSAPVATGGAVASKTGTVAGLLGAVMAVFFAAL